MGIDTRLLLRMPPTLSLGDCFAETSKQAFGALPAEQRASMKDMLLASAGERLTDGTLVFRSDVHFAPPRNALERQVANLSKAFGPLPALTFTPSPQFERVLGDFRARGGVDGAFERFRDAVLEELVERFGSVLKQMHDDPRGVLAFPEIVQVQASGYDAAVAQVEREGVWLPFPPSTLR